MIVALSALAFAAGTARAARYTYEPVSDFDDGQLTNGSVWDYRPSDFDPQALLLTLGNEQGVDHDNSLAFGAADLPEGGTVTDARLRLNEQGGLIGSGLVVEISAALSLDPLAVPGGDRFGLPRTNAKVAWNISAAWDSSFQRIAKWTETPDLSPVVNELLAQPGWDASPKVMCFFLEPVGAASGNFVRYDDTHAKYWNGGNPGVRPARLVLSETFHDAFHGKELLCRPKPHAMQVNIVPHAGTEAYVEWGTDGVSFPSSTSPVLVPGDTAHEFEMSGLSPDTDYFYRLRYRPAGGSTWETGDTHSFLTLPLPGTESRICVTSDIHVTNTTVLGLDTHLDLLGTTLGYMAEHLAPRRYHLWIDLGDLVVIRAQRTVFDAIETEQRYREAREWIDRIGHSLPFILVRGNHEEVNGWDYDGTPDNTTIWSGTALRKWFPPPVPDEFYSGNANPFPHLGLAGDYFSFRAGDLSIRALDPYLYSQTRPHNAHNQTNGSKSGWDWQLGEEQYLWLHDDLDQNPGTFNLVATHHLTTCYDQPGYWYGRGGVEVVDWSISGRPTFEWGGQDSTGADVLATQRSGYVYGSIHDMLAGLGNQIVMKGHDHFYARQQLDGMTYLTLPKPDDTGQHTGDLWGFRFASDYPDSITTFEENSGFLSIVAGGDAATFEYIQTYPPGGLGTVRDSFTQLPSSATGAGIAGPDASRRNSIRAVAPNPFRASSRIEYETGDRGPVRLSIHDAAGRLVRRLVDDDLPAGVHGVRWDGRDRSGRPVAAGVYFAKLRTSRGRTDSVKMIVLR